MVLFREHRGYLEDSMKTVVTINSLEELRSHINEKIVNITSDDVLELSHYTYDDRIKWNTYIVTLNGNAVGFTNGELK